MFIVPGTVQTLIVHSVWFRYMQLVDKLMCSFGVKLKLFKRKVSLTRKRIYEGEHNKK